MSYLPYCGYWFYDPAGKEEMHVGFVSWGLMFTAGVPAPIIPIVPSSGVRRRIGLLVGVH